MISAFRGPLMYMPIAITSLIEVSGKLARLHIALTPKPITSLHFLLSRIWVYISMLLLPFRISKLYFLMLYFFLYMVIFYIVIFIVSQLSVSLKRIETFLNREEIDESAIQHSEDAEKAITMKAASFTWNKAKSPSLKK